MFFPPLKGEKKRAIFNKEKEEGGNYSLSSLLQFLHRLTNPKYTVGFLVKHPNLVEFQTMFKLWSVNKRMKRRGYNIPNWEEEIKRLERLWDPNSKGGYWWREDGLCFIGNLYSEHFPVTFGFFPNEFPYDDPFLPIKKGMTAKEFEEKLKKWGFKRVELKEKLEVNQTLTKEEKMEENQTQRRKKLKVPKRKL